MNIEEVFFVHDNPRWLTRDKGTRINLLSSSIPLSALVTELQRQLEQHPDAVADLDYDEDPYGGFGDHSIEIRWSDGSQS